MSPYLKLTARQFQFDVEQSIVTAIKQEEITDANSSIIIKAVQTHFLTKFQEFETNLYIIKSIFNYTVNIGIFLETQKVSGGGGRGCL